MQLYLERRPYSRLSYQLLVTFLPEKQRLSTAKKISATVSPDHQHDQDISELSIKKMHMTLFCTPPWGNPKG